jgi:hypothetical protein
LYSGTITISEDINNSDGGSSGAPGILSPAVLNFADAAGATRSFSYTPNETTIASTGNYIRISGTSSPGITDTYMNIQVNPALMSLLGPTLLSRNETSTNYTLTLYDTSVNSVTLTDILLGGGGGGGVFTDTTAAPYSGLSGNTYDFTSCTVISTPTPDPACVRTFSYTTNATLADSVSQLTLNATGDVLDAEATVIVDIRADKLILGCGSTTPNCYIGYVTENNFYTITPNGVYTGDATIAFTEPSANFSPITVSWNNDSSSRTITYTPQNPGRYELSATVTSGLLSGNKYMFDMTSTFGQYGNYIWVFATDSEWFSGDTTIPNGGYGDYTLALNGPFIGTVQLADTDIDINAGGAAGGTFDNGGICVFTFASYDPVTNQSSCTFRYTPTVEPDERVIRLGPIGFVGSRPMTIVPIDITVYGFPDIRNISPESGPSTGGSTVVIGGAGLLGVSYITFGGVIDDTTDPAHPTIIGGLPCTNIYIMSDTMLTCLAPAHAAGQVNVFANNIIPPPDIDNTDPENPIITPREPVQYEYFDIATDFTNECYADDGTGTVGWTTTPYVTSGTTVSCHLTLNGRWSGTVKINDDWYSTINPGLAGIIASPSDVRFDPVNSTFTVSYSDTADATGPNSRTLGYTWTSPTSAPFANSWDTLMSYWDPANQDDLWWPLLKVTIPTGNSFSPFLPRQSGADDVVFGLLAQAYEIYPDGNYDFYCIDCEVDFIVSTFGAPYMGTVTVTDVLTNSDNPSGTRGTFWAGGSPNVGSGTLDFAGSDGAPNSFSYIPATTAVPTTTSPTPPDRWIRLQGSNSEGIANAYYDIAPVVDPGISIVPSSGCSFLNRGQTCTYTLIASTGWSSNVTLNDLFMNGTAGGGIFADISGVGGDTNPADTFNVGTNTYTFPAASGETYERTFTYTVRDDGNPSAPNYSLGPFPSHILQLLATSSDSPPAQTFTNVFIYANRLDIKCGVANLNCPPNTPHPVGYVGQTADYAYSPNGALMGTAAVTASDTGAIGALHWGTISATTHVLAYVPTAPGRQALTATMTSSGNIPSLLDNQSFTSTDINSLDDYIYVMANNMQITGPSYLRYATPGTFTLTMNGPFVGTVDLVDYLWGDSPYEGSLSPTSCTFNLDEYSTTNPNGYYAASNRSICTFTYTPALFDDISEVWLVPEANWYEAGPMTTSQHVVTIYGRPIIDSISPTSGPTTGGTGTCSSSGATGLITLTGTNLASTSGSTLNFDTLTLQSMTGSGEIPINLANICIIDNDNISFVAPPNAAGEIDIVVTVGTRVYNHPGYYTYIPSILSISPVIGPTTGGIGFGMSFNPNGTATITGQDIVPAARYADSSGQQYYGLGYLNFTGTEYIDTGVNQLGNTKMTIDTTRTVGQYAAGVHVAGDYFSITLPTTSFMLPTANYGGGANYIGSAGGAMDPAINNRIVATLDANGITAIFSTSLNGGPTSTNMISPTVTPTTPFGIFIGSANNGAGSTGGISGKVYSFTIDKDNDYDDRNFVPVCRLDGNGTGTVGGMFDTLHNVFYPSNGTPFGCDNSSIAPPAIAFGYIATRTSSVVVVDLNTIKVIPPQHMEGLTSVNLTVNGINLILRDSYTFRQPLTIYTVDPIFGPITGGTGITITGHNFNSLVYSDGVNRYAPMEYLALTGTQYIDTGVNPNGNMALEVSYRNDTTGNIFILGARPILNVNGIFVTPFVGTLAGVYNKLTTTMQNPITSGQRHAIGFSTAAGWSFDGVSKSNAPTVLNDTPQNIYLGGINTAGTFSGGMTGRIYSFSLDKDGIADDRNMVPVCNTATNVGGMFDTIHNVFYPSAGTTFACTSILMAGITLDIAGTPASCIYINVIDNNTVTCTTTAHDPGLVSVTVSNGIETFTMAAVPDPNGENDMPTTDNQGRSTGGFLYVDDTITIDLGVSTSSVNLDVSPSAPFDQDYAIVSVATNNPNGYRLYIESSGANLVCTANTSLSPIPSTTLNTISPGTWGFQVGTSTISNGWLPTPLTSTQIASSSGPTFTLPDPTAFENTRVHFAVRDGSPTPISATCPLYEQTITYTVVAN